MELHGKKIFLFGKIWKKYGNKIIIASIEKNLNVLK